MAKKYDVILKVPFDSVSSRLPIEKLMSEKGYEIQKSLFLQGFSEVQKKKVEEIKKFDSFYEVAEIHGDYCQHNTILFPTWHRAYISYLEMLIYNEAKKIVDSYPDDDLDLKRKYKGKLEEVRFPYWDWASPSVLIQGMPSILFQAHVDVTILRKMDSVVVELKKKIPNPLRAYTFPESFGILGQVGDTSNPTQRPYIPDETNYPYTPAGYGTVRHPDENYISNVNSTNFDIVTSCSSTFRPSIWYLINYVDKWVDFSNRKRKDDPDPNSELQTYISIEGVHDMVHLKIGGAGGHMSSVETAGFDPIFYLHHANVDRLTAIWQACYPNKWIEEGGEPNEDTPLKPFKKSETEYWNSKDIRNIENLKYTYPEIENKNSKEDILKYYRPIYDPPKKGSIYKITISVKKNYIGSSFEIRAFIDLPTKSPTPPVTNPHFAGSISIFARSGETSCDNCDLEVLVSDSIDITGCMQRLGLINENNKKEWEPYSTEKSVGITKKGLPERITLIPVTLGGTKISYEDVGLKSEFTQCWELKFEDHKLSSRYPKKLGSITISRD